MLGGSAATPGQPLGTATTMQAGSVATAVTQRTGTLSATGAAVAPTPITAVREPTLKPTLLSLCHRRNTNCTFLCTCLQETLENVKKCRNFLSTLIKLAHGQQSPQTTASVKELIKKLLVDALFFSFFLPSIRELCLHKYIQLQAQRDEINYIWILQI